MIVRVALLALIACGLAGFGTIVWMVGHPTSEAAVAATAPVPIPTVKLLVAAHPLRPGALLKQDDIATRDAPHDEVPPTAILDTETARANLAGGMIRRSVEKGGLIAAADVLRPGDHGFLAAVLSPGTRAITVAVDAVSGTAGLIWPGDRVDLILTQQITGPDELPGHKIAAETILSNVRVIAIDQHLMQGASGPVDATPAQTVTLEVTASKAEQIQVATRLGRLSLSVRSAEPGAPDQKQGTTWAGDVSPALIHDHPRAVAATMNVFAGSGAVKEFKF